MIFNRFKAYIIAGLALGFVLGLWNLIAFWTDPLDDTVAGMVVIYGPMFTAWSVAGFVAARRSGRIVDALSAGATMAFATFLMFWVMNFLRVNLFLDALRDWPGWQATVVARYRASRFESFRAFVTFDYLKDAPLKIGTAALIGAILALIGGVVGIFSHRTRATP